MTCSAIRFIRRGRRVELTRDDLREYAQDYYHHVEAFPSYLAALGMRLEEGELRRAVLANMCDEKGVEGRRDERSSALRAMAGFRRGHGIEPQPGVAQSCAGDPAIDSVISTVSPVKVRPKKRWRPSMPTSRRCRGLRQEKERGLREMYGADDKTCGYFSLHADGRRLSFAGVAQATGEADCGASGDGRRGARRGRECGARLWQALDGIECAAGWRWRIA